MPVAAVPAVRIAAQCSLLALLCCVRAAPAAAAGAGAHPASWPRAHSAGLVEPDSERLVSGLMRRMTLAEKVGQTIQADIGSITPEDLRRYPLGAVLAGGQSTPEAGGNRTPAAWLALARALRAASTEARPGHIPIPILFGIDAIHGNNAVAGATVFPQNIGLGAAHDAALVERIGAATAQQMAVVGMDWTFAPSVSVPQDLRWGRSYESYGQDPALVALNAAALVHGLQGDPDGNHKVQNAHVAATAKHFIGDGGTRDGVDQGDTQASERELIRVHAPGYVAAIDAGVMSVMASFSSWQGVKVHANASLLSGVLKGQLGFEGFVVSDWDGYGQIPGCSTTRCAAALMAGIDMLMAPDGWKLLFEHTLAQVRAGQITRARLDDAVRRILRVKARLGLFDEARPWEGRFDLLASAGQRALARSAVRASLVLLKNSRQLLPIHSSAQVLVAGDGADDIARQCGGWTLGWQGSGQGNAGFPNGESIYAGIRAALAAGGGSAQLAADGSYSVRPDVAIVVFGERPYAERAGDLRSIDYQHGERRDLALLQRLRAAGIPVVSVLLSGRPLDVDPEIDASDAFVAAWLPGSEGGGIADVLIGDSHGVPRQDFSGTLSFDWPASAAAATPAAEFARGYGLHYPAGTTQGCNPACAPD
jgi:beta-glucosidase